MSKPYSGENTIKAIIKNIKSLISSKQDTLTGAEGQTIIFNVNGTPIASDLDLITTDDIDAICGGSIQYSEEVLF